MSTRKEFLKEAAIFGAGALIMPNSVFSKHLTPTSVPEKLRILITGAGTGFGLESALKLASLGHHIIASVEIPSQVNQLKQLAKEKNVRMQVEKLNIADPTEHAKAWEWDIDVLINNAGIAEGGSMVDIPMEHLRKQYEVNVFGPIGFTQGFAKKMINKKKGKIIFISSVAGLTTDPFTGAYSSSKHAVEAFADALNSELQEFGVQIATINPGPFFTGFNDRMFETWRDWDKATTHNVFDYSKINFPHEQFVIDEVIDKIVGVSTGVITKYRNVVPEKQIAMYQQQMAAVWQREQNPTTIGIKHELVKKAYQMRPETMAK